MTLNWFQPSLSLSFASGPCWGGTPELLGADGRGPGALVLGEARPGLLHDGSRAGGGASTGPVAGPLEAEPGLGAAGAVGSRRGGDPGQVNWPRVEGGLPVPPVSWTRPLGNSGHRVAGGRAVTSSSSRDGSQEGPHSWQWWRDRGWKARQVGSADSGDQWHLSWARVLEGSPSS